MQLSLYGAGYLPGSLLDVNAEVQRRINARQAKQSPPQQKAENDDKPLRLSTPDTVEAPKSSANGGPAPSTPVIFNADESMPPVSFDPMQHSATTSAVYTPAGNSVQSQSSHSPGRSDSAASSSGQTQHSAPHEQAELRNINTHSISSSQQLQQQQQQHSGGVRQTDAGEPAVQQAAAVTGVPARLLAQVDSEAAAGQGSGKQRRQSKRERAKGLLSSFTGGRYIEFSMLWLHWS